MATFYNQATLSYSGGTVNSNIATGEILEVLSASKTAVTSEYSQNSQITYIINIVNTGNTAFTDLTVTDNLGAYQFETDDLVPLDYVENSVKYFIDGVLQAPPTVTAGETLEFSGITVPANGAAAIVYAAHVNEFAPPTESGTIENMAVVSTGTTTVTVSETIIKAQEAELNIIKSITPTTVMENGQITYTFEIQNTGSAEATAADNVVITDTFSPVLHDISVEFNGAKQTGDYSYDEATGLFATTAGAITVPAATFTQDPQTGAWQIVPGVMTLTVTGTI